MSEWQPIETAPKDGTQVLITDGTGLCAVASWEDYAAELYDGVGWRDAGDMGWGGTVYHAPTHWMPLPSPPSAVNGEL